MIKFVLLLFVVLVLSPLMLRCYLYIAPGEIVGDINGWLGFLGGYLGGLMAFLSAAILFKQQRSESVRPFFVVTSPDPSSSNGILFFLSSTDSGKIHDKNFLTKLPEERPISTAIEIKNVGVGVALDIAFVDIHKHQAWYFLRDEKIFLDSHLVGIAECGESLTFAIMNTKLPEPRQSTHCFNLKYTDIHGKKYSQKIGINRTINGGFDYRLYK